MAEASFQAYLLAAFAIILLTIILFGIRTGRPPFPYKTTSPWRFNVGVWAIVVGVIFIFIGIMLIDLSSFFTKIHSEEIYKFAESKQIGLEDYEHVKKWITTSEISTDERPLKMGVEKRLHVTVDSQEFPRELVMYVFHEDMKDFFTNENDPSGFSQLTKDLGKVPTLRYGSIFNIKFNMTECFEGSLTENKNLEGCKPLNAFGLVEFNHPGKYFVQFSAKLQNGVFDHRFVPMHLTIIPSDREIFDTERIAEIRSQLDFQRFTTQNALGVAYVGIGIGMFFQD